MKRLAVPLPIGVEIVERRERLLHAERRTAERGIDLGAADAVKVATEMLMARHRLTRDRAYALLSTLARHKELRVEAMADRFLAAAHAADPLRPGQ
jgi:AmiR/NasT family two-component response regulator